MIVSYYTESYTKHAERLIESLRRTEQLFYVRKIEDLGSWDANTYYKATFLREMLDKYDEVIYVDADAIVECKLVAPSGDYDIACHYRNGTELLSGTLILKQSAKPFVDSWIMALGKVEGNYKPFEQRILQHILDNTNARVKMLDARWCKIYDLMRKVQKPLVTHYQASRELRRPTQLRDVPARKAIDGSYWIPRRNKKIEDYMDSHFLRVPRELRWVPKTLNRDLDTFDNVYAGKTGYIVGKGPSLDKLPVLTGGPVIALNEAIRKVEDVCTGDIFAMQQDTALGETCRPKSARLLLSVRSRNLYPLYPRRYVFDPRGWGLTPNCLSVLVALNILKFMGVKKVELYAFDACVNGSLEYARAIGYDSSRGGKKDRFKRHKALIDDMCMKLGLSHRYHTQLD